MGEGSPRYLHCWAGCEDSGGNTAHSVGVMSRRLRLAPWVVLPTLHPISPPERTMKLRISVSSKLRKRGKNPEGAAAFRLLNPAPNDARL